RHRRGRILRHVQTAEDPSPRPRYGELLHPPHHRAALGIADPPGLHLGAQSGYIGRENIDARGTAVAGGSEERLHLRIERGGLSTLRHSRHILRSNMAASGVPPASSGFTEAAASLTSITRRRPATRTDTETTGPETRHGS